MNGKEYLQIEKNAIDILKKNGCQSEDWSQIFVTPDFNPSRVRDVTFKGEVKIGSLRNEIILPGGMKQYSGI